jgi:hypothetical protein
LHRAIAEKPPPEALVDIDALDLAAVHLDGVAGDQAALVDDALIGDGELGPGAAEKDGDQDDDADERHRRGEGEESELRGAALHVEGADGGHQGCDQQQHRPGEEDRVKPGLVDHLLPRQQDLPDITHRFGLIGFRSGGCIAPR